MADLTTILQGTFTQAATAADKILQIRSDIDWMKVYNYTNIGATGNDSVEFYWQRGMANGTGLRYYKDGGGSNLNVTTLTAPSGFYLLDTSVISATKSTNNITNIATGAPPRVTLAAHGYQTGDIVRISDADGAHQLGSIDFYVTRIDANNFDLEYMPSIAVAAAPGADAYAYKVSNEAIFVPKQRVITKITQASSAVITFAAPHDFIVGQVVRLRVPSEFGMTEINNQTARVTAISAANNTITVNVDTSGYTAFSFAATADSPFTPAEAVPAGSSDVGLSSTATTIATATVNEAYIGMKLPAGSDAPGGGDNDVMYWIAGRSFSNATS